MAWREPVETHVRDGPPPGDLVVVVRGGPLTVEKFVQHMRRGQERYSYRGHPLVSISVDAAVAGWTPEGILRERLWSRTSYATTTVGELRRHGYSLLPTFDAPHFDLLAPDATDEVAGTLLSVFGPIQRNPYRRRR